MLPEAMFYLYHHHDLARLAALFMALRRTAPAAPLAPDQVLVPNPGVGRWLKMQLAEREGIAANIDAHLPAPFFWQLVAGSLPGERPDSSAYRREHLRWHLYALLPTLAQTVPAVARYLGDASAELRRWQLADRLADLFDQYLIYRRDMLFGWERGDDPPTGPASWQAPLWRALVARLGPNHRARLLGEFVARVATGGALDRSSWPARLYCFALGNLPPDYLRLLYALARHTDVHFLMQNPSDVYWGDIVRQPLPLDSAVDGAPLPGEDAIFAEHSLLANLGGAGRDFLRLLYSDEFAEIRELELGPALAYEPPGQTTLLHRLQSGVITLDATCSAQGLEGSDRSFQVHACHGTLREVQVLHDQLLDLLTADPSLEPRDIVVVTPKVGDFAPAIAAVFGAADGAATIPYGIADQPRRASHPIVLMFRALLDLPLWRSAASELFSLVAVPAVMRRYELTTDDVENLRRWADAAGIRWGIDADHREQTGAGHWGQNSWTFGLDRLLLGVALADPEALADGVAPAVDLEGGATAALGQLWLLLERLRHWRAVLPEPLPASAWQERLNALCEELFATDPYDRDEVQALQAVHEAVATLTTAADCLGSTPLSWQAVREVIDGALDESSQRQPFFAGGVTFCGLVPLRTLPFRVVCLIGMNEGDFPRQDRHRAINLIRRSPRLGDASTRADDRLLLLQWLLAARDVFYISYTGQDTANGEELAPATVVAELLDFVGFNQFAGVSRRDALAKLVTRQPMQPFSPRYFSGPAPGADSSRVFTFRAGWRAGTSALFRDRAVAARLIDDHRAPRPAVAELALGELQRFLEHPPRYFLREVLGVELELPDARTADEEPLKLDPRATRQLRQTLFARAQTAGPLPLTPDRALGARGVLPPPPLDVEPYRKIAGELNALLPVWQRAREAGEPAAVAIDIPLSDGLRLVGRVGDVYPDGLRRIDARRLDARTLLGHWIDLLALAATGHPGRLTCGGFDQDGALLLRDGSIDRRTAREQLEALVAAYLDGQQRPLCFLPGLGMEYVERLAKGQMPDAALRHCNGRATTESHKAWEAEDPWNAALLAEPPAPLGVSAASSAFCASAEQILGPLLATLSPLSLADSRSAEDVDR